MITCADNSISLLQVGAQSHRIDGNDPEWTLPTGASGYGRLGMRIAAPLTDGVSHQRRRRGRQLSPLRRHVISDLGSSDEPGFAGRDAAMPRAIFS